MKNASRLTIALLAGLLGPVAAFAAGSADSVTVADPYVRMVPPGAKATAAFMVLKNAGDKDTKLVKVESTAAKTVELHNHINDNGVMRMRQVTAIDVKAKGEAALKPGGYHVMLIDPTAALKEGDKVGITLGFADGSSKKIDAVVRKPEVPVKTEMDHSHHDHKH